MNHINTSMNPLVCAQLDMVEGGGGGEGRAGTGSAVKALEDEHHLRGSTCDSAHVGALFLLPAQLHLCH